MTFVGGTGSTCLCPVGNPASCTNGACHANATICKAVLGKAVLEFEYEGIPRVVEPHYYGLTRKDNQAIRGYQANWGGVRTQEPGWRIFTLDKVVGLRVSSAHFDRTRPEYNAADSQMNGYFARLE